MTRRCEPQVRQFGLPNGRSRAAKLRGELSVTFVLPQFEMIESLGCGGMGAVYKARQKSLDRLVALKIINPDAAEDPGFAERFAREAKALAKLNRQNIVGVHEFGESDSLFYFVMEFVDGTNLRHLIESKQLTPDQALQIVSQVCEALQFAHDEGIVHRDIKPDEDRCCCRVAGLRVGIYRNDRFAIRSRSDQAIRERFRIGRGHKSHAGGCRTARKDGRLFVP